MTKSDQSVTIVGVHEAKTHLSRILRLVESGGEVHITRGSEPIARIVPMESAVREIGFAADRSVVIPDDFDDPDPELVESFYAE
ncbi:MAG: type II toxin-antitoxin system prevent-host-death family antitoxin [Microlunatus sp.]|nr:type II toxin-antitoxin system prevent-host-death family antitoxin [Microlunatus sp.]MDN5769956.1 type II toxin-antitoxin system prevent-host-death family antitoxin [Microlunatus sp.]MDN5803693.1 type II toxin-antitoxin system prevent-host-death family antitoxin [Microlunatus sp.]